LSLVIVTPSLLAASLTLRVSDDISWARRSDEPQPVDGDDLLVLLRDYLLGWDCASMS
jgi:hypothetical protein